MPSTYILEDEEGQSLKLSCLVSTVAPKESWIPLRQILLLALACLNLTMETLPLPPSPHLCPWDLAVT